MPDETDARLRTALVVEDEPAVLRGVVRRLQRNGFTVHGAPDLNAGRDLLAKCRFDVAVVDQNLPDGRGAQLLRELAREQPDCARIMMTAGAALKSVVRAVNSGELHQFLLKPFLTSALLEAVSHSIDRVRSQQMAALRAQRAERSRHDLSELLAGRDFRLDWQPIVGVRDGALLGVEGFMRSERPELSRPQDILRLAERLGMMRHVGRAVVGRASPVLAELPGPTYLFLNLHPEELADQDALEDQLAPLTPVAERICLEVTGRALERWPRTLGAKLERLRELGFGLVLDDLGAGQGALSMLAEVSPRFIKAHQSIVRDVHRHAGHRRLVEMVCAFAAASGAEVVAEGVEQAGEAEVLRELGVTYLQGYHIGQPGSIGSAMSGHRLWADHWRRQHSTAHA